MNTIDEAVADLIAGKMLVVMDDEDRENEGDLVCAAEFCTPEMVNFMTVKGKGLICVPLSAERAAELELEPMVRNNTSLHETGFTVSVDYLIGTTTGISAADRAKTIQALANPDTKVEELGKPGHIFPLIAVKEGVLRRAGHTEAVVNLMEMAGLNPAGVLCEIINEDGSMARMPELMRFAREYNLKIITVKDLIAYRIARESLVECVAKAKMPTDYGEFQIYAFKNAIDGLEHVAIVKGDVNKPDEPVLVRVHSECLTGDVFASLRCDCGNQLHAAMSMVSKESCGVVVYMRQEGRGIGLTNKIRAYELQDNGYDTVEANIALGFADDPRDYGIGAQILRSLGIHKMRLITNNPKKRVGLESYGLEVVERVPLELLPNEHNHFYMQTKKAKLGHILENV